MKILKTNCPVGAEYGDISRFLETDFQSFLASHNTAMDYLDLSEE